jgi:hypothetical protein
VGLGVYGLIRDAEGTIAARVPNIGRERRSIQIGDREAREERMDELERQMGHLREQMQRPLSRAEGSGRQTALKRLRSAIPGFAGFAGRAAARDTGVRAKDGLGSAEGPDPTHSALREAGGSSQEATERPEERSRWRRLFGG